MSSALSCDRKSLCSSWKVVRVYECLPPTALEILKWPTEIVQKAPIHMGRFELKVRRRPEQTWNRVDDLTELVFAFPQGLLAALAFCYVCRSAHQFDELSVPIEERVPC